MIRLINFKKIATFSSLIATAALVACTTVESPKWVSMQKSDPNANDISIMIDPTQSADERFQSVTILGQPSAKFYEDGGSPVFSIIFHATIDCQDETMQILKTEFYDQLDGLGEITETQTDSKSAPFGNNPTDQFIYEQACNRGG